MNFKWLALILILLFSGSTFAADDCRFYIRNKQTADFSETLAQSCRAFSNLCTYAPYSLYCKANVIRTKKTTNVDALKTQEILEQDFNDSMAALSENLFQNSKTYVEKLKIMDEESRSTSTLRRTYIANLVFYTTGVWFERHGDVLHEYTKTLKETGEGTAMLAYVGVIFASAGTEALKRTLLNKFGLTFTLIARNSKRLRLVLPLIGVRVALPVAAGVADANQVPIKYLPPSPAHIVQFTDKSDLEVMSADEEAELAVQDIQVLKSVVGTTAGWAGMSAVGSVEIAKNKTRWAKFANEVLFKGRRVVKAAKPVAKVVKFARVTPMGIAAGYVIEDVAGEAIAELTAKGMAGIAEIKFLRARTVKGANTALNEIYFAQMRNAKDGRRTIEFYKSLKNFGTLRTKGVHPTLIDITRNQFTSHFLKQNLPESSGASIVKSMVCKLKTAKTDSWLNRRKAASLLNVTTDMAVNKMVEKVKDYRSGLSDLRSSLRMLSGPVSKLKLGTKIQRYALETRIAAIDRAIKEADEVSLDLRRQPKFMADSGAADFLFQHMFWTRAGSLIKQYVTHIVAIEKRANKSNFDELYSCRW